MNGTVFNPLSGEIAWKRKRPSNLPNRLGSFVTLGIAIPLAAAGELGSASFCLRMRKDGFRSVMCQGDRSINVAAGAIWESGLTEH
jgi:hypothetical protein